MADTQEILNVIFEDIASNQLNIETLTARNSDRLDFHDVSVWDIRRALETAYSAGANDEVGRIRAELYKGRV